MKIIYLHHANRNGTLDEITSLGKKEAKIIAKLLNDKQKSSQQFTAIYSAQSNRCLKTAEIINSKLHLPIFTDKNLDEFNSQYESWLDAQLRLQLFLKQIVDKYDNNAVIICITSGVNVAAFIDFANKRAPNKNNSFVGIMSCSPIVFDVQKNH